MTTMTGMGMSMSAHLRILGRSKSSRHIMRFGRCAKLANRNEVVKKELLKVAPTITPKPTVFSVAKNGLKGNLRLIRPSAYDPRCIVIVSVPVKKGGSNIPPSVASVMKIRGCFKRYGPISHVLGYEAKGATTREYYVTFKEAASAAKVYAESECVQGRNPHLTLQRCVPLPASYGDWLARFCVGMQLSLQFLLLTTIEIVFSDKTVLPDNCVYLSSTHPSNLNATLTLSHAACEPAIEPIPQVTLPSTSVPLDQGASYVPQSTETKASMKAMKAINNVLLRAEEIRGSLLPTKGVPRVSALEMIKTAGRLYDIELALMTYPEIPRPDRLSKSLQSAGLPRHSHISPACILQAISHIPDFIIPDNDIYNIRRRCQHLLGSPASAVGPPTIAPSLSGKTFVVPSVSYNTLPSHPVLQNSLPGRPILPAPPSTRDKRTGPPQSMAQKPQLPSHLHQPGINQNLSLSNSHHFGLADRRVSVKREREYDMDRPDSRDDLDVKRLRY
ncbi:hypothetical protein DL93DRAFT_375576 [Clavulina sp. PMI_390]|nr:hypothetical protein DL93DRAFT_375576 [Clavulina sp. PMI_390]